MIVVPDVEQCADPLDQAGQATLAFTESRIADARFLAEPEQIQNEDGTWPVTECVDCDADLGKRMALAKVRCIHCQAALEKKRGGYGLG